MAKTLTINIPAPGVRTTFATRARRRAGLGAFVGEPAKPPLPAANVFAGRGLGAFYGHPATGPANSFAPLARGMRSYYGHPATGPANFFAPLARGMRAFFARTPQPPLPAAGPLGRGVASFFTRPVRVPLPAGNVFAAYGGHNCATCTKRCFKRRGMGQGSDLDLGYDPSALLTTGGSDNPYGAQSIYGLSTPGAAPTYDVGIAQEPTVSPLTLPPGTGTGYSPSTNPSLDAYNQALTNAQASNPALLNPNTLATLSNAAAVATPAQLATATAALNQSSTTSLSTWLASSTLISGYPNTTVLLGAGAIGVLLLALMQARKGRR